MMFIVLACLFGVAVSQNSCGVRPSTRIVGGGPSNHGDWPWQAMLMTSRRNVYRQFCGGALVANNWVVTAAHCVSGMQAKKMKVRMGAHYRSKLSGLGVEQDFDVAKIISHESYNKPMSMSHDIALLKLASSATYTQYVHPVCLPASVAEPPAGQSCWITGWGTTSSGGSQPDVLHQAQVPIVSRAECENAYPGEIHHDSMICAGLKQGGIDSCQGDSGGPMVCEDNGAFYLHGATSWGYGCAFPDRYGVYARVKYLHKWIADKMATN